MAMPVLPPIDWEEIERRYRAGDSLRAIAANHGISHQAISKRAWSRRWERAEVSTPVASAATEPDRPLHGFPERREVREDVVAYVGIDGGAVPLAIFENTSGQVVLDWGDNLATVSPTEVPKIIRRLRELAAEMLGCATNELKEMED
jgi:hypothetical protein